MRRFHRLSIPVLPTIFVVLLGSQAVLAAQSPKASEYATVGELRSLSKCLDGGGISDGDAVVIRECDGSEGQIWNLDGLFIGESDFQIVGPGERCLVPGAIRPSGNQEVTLGPCDGSLEDRWDRSLTGNFPKVTQFVHQASGSCLDVLGAQSADGTPILLFPCHGEINQTWSFQGEPLRGARLLPSFEVDLDNPFGRTTLYAVRNDSDAEVLIHTRYYGKAGIFTIGDSIFASETVPLAPKAVRTIDIRTVNLEVCDGTFGAPCSRGYVTVQALDPETEEPTPGQDLSGDFFHLDPQNNFASGGRLEDITVGDRAGAYCNRWVTRFLEGGPFSGGTTFQFFLDDEPGDLLTSGPVITGEVYDEAGRHVKTVTVGGSQRILRATASALELEVAFGAVEWTIDRSRQGMVSATYSALGRYSVTAPGTCKD